MFREPRAAAYSRPWLLYACFVASGAAGLILEIVWSKYLSLLLGNSIYAVSTVVAAFLGGLGIGAWAGGRIAERTRNPLEVYARLEALVGFLGLVSPLAYLAARPLFAALYAAMGGGGALFLSARFLLLFVALLAPTVAMGASLPLLAADLARRGSVFGSIVGRLYALNTAGAVLGVVAAGFVSIPLLGLWRTAVIAAGLDFAVAVSVLLLRPPPLPAAARVPQDAPEAHRAGGSAEPVAGMRAAQVVEGGSALAGGRAEAGRALPKARRTETLADGNAPASSRAPKRAADGRAALPRGRAQPSAGRGAHPEDGADPHHGVGAGGGEPQADIPPPVFARLIVPLFAVSGFTAILDEIAWTRILSVPLGGMVYALSAILALYLLGIAIGSALAARALRSLARPVLVFGILQIALAGAVAAGGHVFGWIPGWQASLIMSAGGSPARLILGEAAIAALVVLPPTLLLGALFPLAAAIARLRGGQAGATVGVVYAANTIGSIAGSLLTGFVLIPGLGFFAGLGALGALLAGAAANLAIGLVALLLGEGAPGRRRLAAVGVLAAAVVFVLAARPAWPAQRMSLGFTRLLRAYRFGGEGARGEKIVREMIATSGTERGSERLRFYREGRLASVAVIESPGRMALVVNGKPDATTGTGEDMMTQVMVGQIPLLLSPRAQDVCIVGYGSGVTTHAVLTHSVREVLTLEIEQAVIDAAPWFRDGAFDPLSDARSRLVIEDAGTYLRSTSRQFDVIVSEPSNPWIAGVGDLFTKEFYAEAAARLKPGGLFCQWLQCYEISPPTMWTIFRTLASRFPSGQIFFFRPSNDLVIVASPDRDVVLDPKTMEAVFAKTEVARDLARVGVVSVPDLLRYYRGRLARIARIAGEGPLNSDDNGWLEHHAPLDLIQPPARGEPLGWSPDVAEDLAASLGPDSDAAAAALVQGIERALSARDRSAARGFHLALQKRGRREADEVAPRLAALEGLVEAAKQAEALLSEATPLVLRASQGADAELGGRAAGMLARAALLDPANGDVAWRLGTALIAARRPAEALAELRRALALLPVARQFPVRRDLAVANFFRGDLAACLAESEEMDRLRAGSAEACYWRARVYQQQGQAERAKQEVARGLRAEPTNARLIQLRKELGF